MFLCRGMARYVGISHHPCLLARKGVLCSDRWADFGAPFFNSRLNGVADLAGAGELLLMCAWECGGVGKSPMQAGGDAGKDGAAFGAGFIANGDDIGEDPAGFEQIEYPFGLVGGD